MLTFLFLSTLTTTTTTTTVPTEQCILCYQSTSQCTGGHSRGRDNIFSKQQETIKKNKWSSDKWSKFSTLAKHFNFLCNRFLMFISWSSPVQVVFGLLFSWTTRGGGRSEAGHCFHQFFFLLFFLSCFFFFLCLLLFTHFGESPVHENLFPPIFWHN